MLPCTFCGGNVLIFECVHPLAAKDRAMIRSGQGISKIRLIPDAVSSVLRLAVYGVTGNAVGCRLLLTHERHIVAACSVPCGHGRRNGMRTGVSGVNPVVFIQHQWLVSMLLGAQGTGHFLLQFHSAASLIVQAENRRHHVAPIGAFERRGAFRGVTDASRAGPGSCAEGGRNEGLLFHPRLGAQRTCHIVKVPHLVPLVGGEGDRIIRNSLQWDQSRLYHQRRFERRQ